MTTFAGTGPRARAIAVLALGAFALHQLRYLVAFGGDAGRALDAQGHAYLAQVLPVLAALALLALAVTVLRPLLAPESIARSGAGSRLRPALACAGVLLAAFACQELAEGLLAGGHPGGLAALYAEGGWLALPLAVLLGIGVSLVLGALAAIEVVIAARARRHRPRPRPRRRASTPASPFLIPRAAAPLAFGLARRPPPAPSIH
jgi:hypothetical protein